MVKNEKNESLILENFRYWQSKNLYINLMEKKNLNSQVMKLQCN